MHLSNRLIILRNWSSREKINEKKLSSHQLKKNPRIKRHEFLEGKHRLVPSTVDEKRCRPRQLLVKFQSTRDKGKILKASRTQNRPQTKERESDWQHIPTARLGTSNVFKISRAK